MADRRRSKRKRNVRAGDEYAMRLGARLREVRRQRGLSLIDLEAMTSGEFKASVLGAYERGERAISVPRLARLAECYGVVVEELLPVEDRESSPPVAQTQAGGSVTLDLVALERSSAPEADTIARYVSRIRRERGSWNEPEMTVRKEDVRVMSAFLGLSEEELLSRLAELGLVRGTVRTVVASGSGS